MMLVRWMKTAGTSERRVIGMRCEGGVCWPSLVGSGKVLD
jgi:hypothetical protein